MSNIFLKTAVKIGFSLVLAAAGAAVFFGRVPWALGVLTAACWMFLNVYFLFRLLAIGFGIEAQKRQGRLLVLSVLKFPVIYLTGYFILKTRYFPLGSIVTGLTLFMIGLIVSWFMFGKNAGLLEVSKKKDSSSAVGILRTAFFILFSLSSAVCGLQSPSFASEPHGESRGDSSLHTVNLVGLVGRFLPEQAAGILAGSENVIFGVTVIAILGFIFYFGSRNMRMVPVRLQASCEAVVECLNGFVCGILGPGGKKYTPFLGTLFLYILTMNLLGLVPLMKSNTANSMTLSGPVALPVPTTTVALALIVFVTVQVIGIKEQGILGYLDHMAGSPRDVFGFVMAPLMFPIHLIGELAKPFSLTFRLFCNTMGGHILVAVFVGMGVASMLIPFQAPFLLFEIATGTIQAFVFTLLSTVYIAMMMPHGDHEKHHSTAEVH